MSNTEDLAQNEAQKSAAGTRGSEAEGQELKPDEGDFGTVQADLDRFRDLALRTQADFENFRKRAAREREEGMRYANVSLIEKLIPIMDNFELGLEAARKDEGAGAILSGLEMVYRQLQELLASQGVEVVEALGQPFDPNLHEAIGQEANAEVAEGIVLRQLRKGFKLKDRLVRPANVIVSKGAPAQD